ncbi:rhodanese-like domain-containing protein [Nonomuraea sp. NPDC059194]|uniref:rhodanese-like domain-containing protein n=1 Tax=Nonomuraea sp. NPDC059194 TaxID=3346764 RepID=UPI0036CC584A
MSIDDLLLRTRTGLTRLTPEQAWAMTRAGDGLLADTRPEWQRRRDGEVPDAVVIERNHLEWRLDPRSAARVPEASSATVRWIVLCDEGYASSLAAASLRQIGLALATDVIGGFQAWIAAGLPANRPAVPVRPRGPGEGPGVATVAGRVAAR